MLKVSVGTLALLAAPADQQQETPPPPPPQPAGAAGEAIPPLQPPQSDSEGGGDGTGGGGGGDDGDNNGPMRARQRALAGLSASVRSQLELHGDLSRAVGHAEAALVCASLLRDAAGATATLG